VRPTHTVTGSLTPTWVITLLLSHLAAGTVNLCSPDHVSLLVHRTFNVSIPRHHIPQTEWVFEYGPAENDPEYGAGSAAAREPIDAGHNDGGEAADIVMRDGDATVEGQEDHTAETSGRWVHAVTGLPLGGPTTTLEFTVVG
jgi:DNA-directed RNA polymerase I subunit RPA43